MEDVRQAVKCGNCDVSLVETPNLPLSERKPCPSCGSESRTVELTARERIGVTLRDKIRLKARHGSRGKPFLEITAGDDLQRNSARWMKLERVVDRARNWYRELVRDPESGQVVHRCEERLTDHRGHGSARGDNSV